MKIRSFGFIVLLIGFALSLAYVQGYRIISFEEIPCSHRPGAVFLTTAYAQQHLSERD